MAYRGRGLGRGHLTHSMRQPPMEMFERQPYGLHSSLPLRQDHQTGNIKLHIRSIPKHWTKNMLLKTLRSVAEPINMEDLKYTPGVPYSYTFVEFKTFDDVRKVVQLCNSQAMEGIQVMHARRKPEYDSYDFDELMESDINHRVPRHYPGQGNHKHINIQTLVNAAETYGCKKTVSNDKFSYSFDLPLGEFCSPQEPSLEDVTCIEEFLFDSIVKIDLENPGTGKCDRCKASSHFGCPICGTSYCSNDCFNKDWPGHSRNCVPLQSVSESTNQGCPGAGDSKLVNGNHYSSYDKHENRGLRNRAEDPSEKRSNEGRTQTSDTENQNGFSHNRFNGNRNQSRDRGKNPSKDPENWQNNDDRSDRGSNFGDRQSDQKGSRNMFEERRQKSVYNNQKKSNETCMRPNRQPNEKEDWGGSANADLESQPTKSSEAPTLGKDFIDSEKAFLNKPPATAHKFLQSNIFTMVNVVHRNDNNIAVTPSSKIEELEKLMEGLQVEAESSPSLDPKPNLKCIIKWLVKNKWYRARIISVEEDGSTVNVNLVDNGNLIHQKFSYGDVRAIPAKFEKTIPLVTVVKANKGTNPQILVKDVFCVKPVFKDADLAWVVDAIPAPKEEIDFNVSVPISKNLAPTSSNIASPYPDFLPADRFSTVVIIYVDELESRLGDTYFVGNTACAKTILEMCEAFANVAKDCETIPATLGAVGISKFDEYWYRARVVSEKPLKLYFIDYGNTNLENPENFKKCPESHREMKPLVQKIKLAPGTNQKYYSLPDNSQLSVKPVALIVDAVIVHIEGETYSNAVIQHKTPPELSQIQVKAPVTIKQEPVSPQKPPQPPLETLPKKPLQQNPPAEHQPAISTLKTVYPDIFSIDGFTDVIITQLVSSGNELVDTYYVSTTVALLELQSLTVELNKVASLCQIISPQVGDLVLAIYSEEWYRVKVVSISPLQVFYIDYGNTEVAESVRKLADKYKDRKPLVQRIKLASGTNNRFYNLSENSRLSVKPVALADDTVVVQVEGSIYQDAALTPQTEPESSQGQPIAPVAVKQEPVSPEQSLQPPLQKLPVQPLHQNPPAEHQPALSNLLSTTEVPDIFSVDRFQTVTITQPASGDSNLGDTYYVASQETLLELTTWSQELNLIAPTCDEINSPQVGALALACYSDMWSRAKVVSISPLQVFYVDFGNTEIVETLRKLPEKYENKKPLVYKIKLAPGTSQKYFNLPELSQLKVKPVAELSSISTTLVQVEGETYEESHKEMVVESSMESMPPASATPVQAVYKGTWLVDLLAQGWQVRFVPNKLIGDSLIGTTTTINIPVTEDFLLDGKFATLMETKSYDPSYIPKEGDLVTCENNEDWARGRVLVDNLCALVDDGLLLRTSQVKKVVEDYVNIPYLAGVLTPYSTEQSLLNELKEVEDIMLKVDRVEETNGQRLVEVSGQFKGNTIFGTLKSWDCNLLSMTYPLNSGDRVVITTVLDSNTFMVTPEPSADFKADQTVQIACNQSDERFSAPPSVGDYVAFSNNNFFYRSKVVGVNTVTGEYRLLKIDIGNYSKGLISNLKPLPKSLYHLAARATRVELKDVDKIPKVGLTELAERYIRQIIQDNTVFVMLYAQNLDAVELINENQESFNTKLTELIKPKLDLNGKLTLASLPPYQPPLNKKIEVLITLTEPLYMHLKSLLMRFANDIYPDIVIYMSVEKQPYNPCVGELCLVSYEEWFYRALCMKETNTGVSHLKLLDYGNIIVANTVDIRKMDPAFLNFPCFCFPCKISGLSPEEKTRINDQLVIDSAHCITVEAIEKDDTLIINMPDLKL